MSRKNIQILSLTLLIILAVAFDQWTKKMAVLYLKAKNPFVIWDGVFELHYSENSGAAFGILQGQQWFFFIIGIVVLAAAIYILFKLPEDKRFVPLGLVTSFVASGAVGNMIDRLSQGYVVDFLYFKLIDFPIFNIADCYVTISMAVLILLMVFRYHEEDFAWFSGKKKGENI